MSIYREQIKKRLERSSEWPRVRKEHLKKQPACANCGKTSNMLKGDFLEVHHIKPFHLFPELELVDSNLLTLCSDPRCHLDKGHLGDYRSYNLNVIGDCEEWLKKYKTRP